MAQYLEDTQLADLLPSSIKEDSGISAAASAVQPDLSAILDLIPRALIYHNLEGLPDDILNLVAWGWHVDGYDLLETRAERLHVVRNFFDYHRFKGTKKGLQLYFSTFLRRELLAASPPSKSFIGSGLSEAEIAAWIAPHPEVRVYPYRHSGKRMGAHVGDFAGHCFPNTGDALLRIGDQVTLYDPLDGSETALDSLSTSRDTVTRIATQYVPVALRGSAGESSFVGRFIAGYLANQDAASRMYVLEQAAPYQDELSRRQALSIRPSQEPFKVGYDWEAIPGDRGRVSFLGNRWPDVYPQTGGGFMGGIFVQSTAKDRIYKRTKLFDPSRVAFKPRETSTFLGAFLLGALKPHHAEASVDMARSGPPSAAFVCGFLNSRKFFTDLGTREWIELMRRVGKMAARYSDKISVSVTNRRQVTASSGLLAGSAVAGQYKLEVM